VTSRGGRGAAAAFAPVSLLFFAWGFISANNDPLLAGLREIFRLSYTDALLTQIVSFAAFGLASLPAALLVARIGSVPAILAALGTMIAGCLLVQTTRFVADHRLVLAGVFVVASGITALQVAANPIAASAGAPERSHFRLTLAQFFNALGVVCGVYFGAALILGGGLHDLAAVQRAFLIIAAALSLTTAFVWIARRAIASAAAESGEAPRGGLRQALKSRWALLGAAAIAFYVGAEVAIGSIMINFLAAPERLGIPLRDAGFLLANFYWGGALVGRLLGAMLMIRLKAAPLLAGAAATAAMLCALVLATSGPVAACAALSIGLFNSIMFPTIFALTLERSKAPKAATSGLLCLGIAFGAPIPWLVGRIADGPGLSFAFAPPFAAYAFILLFALVCARSAHQPRRNGLAAGLPPADAGP
jgi:FHS family L-fucose permease-like MFS transporter